MSHDVPLYTVTEREMQLLRGAGPLAIALYLVCLKGHTEEEGRHVANASYARFSKQLAFTPSGMGGPRVKPPALGQLRSALERLEAFGLVTIDRSAAAKTRQLRIWLLFP